MFWYLDLNLNTLSELIGRMSVAEILWNATYKKVGDIDSWYSVTPEELESHLKDYVGKCYENGTIVLDCGKAIEHICKWYAIRRKQCLIA